MGLREVAQFLRKFAIISAILSVVAVNPWTQALSRSLRTLERLQQMDERTEEDEETEAPHHSGAAKSAILRKLDDSPRKPRLRRALDRWLAAFGVSRSSGVAPLQYARWWHPSLRARVFLPRRAPLSGDDSACQRQLTFAALA
jgi:hypothetical protein